MSEGPDAVPILRKWLELTRAEGAAIRHAAWNKVLEIQSNKSNLRPLLARAAAQAKSAGISAEISVLLGRIRSHHARNDAALLAQRQRLAFQRETVRCSRNNLIRLKSSYAGRPLRAAWHSYS